MFTTSTGATTHVATAGGGGGVMSATTTSKNVSEEPTRKNLMAVFPCLRRFRRTAIALLGVRRSRIEPRVSPHTSHTHTSMRDTGCCKLLHAAHTEARNLSRAPRPVGLP